MQLCATLVLLAALAQDPQARVHALLFERVAPDGKTYGAAELDPLLFPASRWILEPAKEQELLAALDALHATDLHARPVRERLVLQRDLWAAHDCALRHSACTADELHALRASGEGLPAGLLDATQGWVRLADALGRSITPAHERDRDGRSRFEVLLRLPGGREPTLAWLERLRALPDPLTGPQAERRFRADLPLLPAQTEVALVRRALAIDAQGELVATQLVESVELRRFLVEDPSGTNPPFSFDLSKAQELAVFRLDRSGAHELRAFGADELDFPFLGSHGEDPFDGDLRSWGWLKPGQMRCGSCHAQPGIYSLNSFTRMPTGPGTVLQLTPGDRPSVLVEADTAVLEAQALAYKRGRDSWRALEPPWERLRRALFVRTGPDGKLYGANELDPLLFPQSTYLLGEERSREITAALDAAPPVEGLGNLQRALLQRELWCVFDWLVEHHQEALAGRIAPLLKALALDAAQLRALPAQPDVLPSAGQGWVLLGDARGRSPAQAHQGYFRGRSHFEVLVRLPEGRKATLAYFERLRASAGEPPQFPPRTAVALVRRLVLFDRSGELVLTPLVESVQLRTYLAIAAPGDPSPFTPDLSQVQEVAEFHLARDGGLRKLAAGEPDFSAFGTHGGDPFEEGSGREPWIGGALQRCGACHGQAGIYGINSFTLMTSGPGTITSLEGAHAPILPVEGDPLQQLEATLASRRDSDSWRALFPR